MAGPIEQGARLPRDVAVAPMQDAEHLVLEQRMVKDEHEIASLRRAFAALQDTLQYTSSTTDNGGTSKIHS